MRLCDTFEQQPCIPFDAGSIDVGKLADIIMVEGNPLENIAATHKVKRVIANGRVYELDDLLKGMPDRLVSTQSR